MSRLSIYGLIAVTSIGLGVVIVQRCMVARTDAGAAAKVESAASSGPKPLTTAAPAATTAVASQFFSATYDAEGVPQAIRAADRFKMPTPTYVVEAANLRRVAVKMKVVNTQAGPLAHTQDSDWRAVGRPLPISASVDTSCKYCERERELLSIMTEESRDQAWASSAEARLRNIVLAEGDKYEIRAIECRETLCVLEVSSIHGPFLGFKYEEEQRIGLSTRGGLFGYEKNDSGMRVTVSLKIINRRR